MKTCADCLHYYELDGYVYNDNLFRDYCTKKCKDKVSLITGKEIQIGKKTCYWSRVLPWRCGKTGKWFEHKDPEQRKIDKRIEILDDILKE